MGKFGIYDIRACGGLLGGSLLEVRHQDKLIGYLRHLGGAKWRTSTDCLDWSPIFIGYRYACHHLRLTSTTDAGGDRQPHSETTEEPR